MKIISSFKDYYDYKINKYGLDNKLIYNRKTINKNTKDQYGTLMTKDSFYNDTFFHHQILFIGNEMIHIFKTKAGKYYTSFDIEEIINDENELYKYLFYTNKKIKIKFKDGKVLNVLSNIKVNITDNNKNHKTRNKIIKNLKEENKKNKNKINVKEFETPIILINNFSYSLNPNLNKIGIYIDEDFVWQALVQYFSNKLSENEIVPKVDDKLKIQNKGFDLKTSFRPKIKKQ